MQQKTDVIEMGWQSIVTQATTEVFHPASGWMGAADLAKARAYGEARDKNGTGIQWALAYQTANDPRSPDAHTKITTLTGSNGMIDPEQVALTIETKRFVRVGWAVVVTSGTGCVRVGGRVELIHS